MLGSECVRERSNISLRYFGAGWPPFTYTLLTFGLPPPHYLHVSNFSVKSLVSGYIYHRYFIYKLYLLFWLRSQCCPVVFAPVSKLIWLFNLKRSWGIWTKIIFQLLTENYFEGKTKSDLVDVYYICAYKTNVEK